METHKPYELKNTLMNKKDELQQKIIFERTLSPEEKRVYAKWLEFVNRLINICVERNKF